MKKYIKYIILFILITLCIGGYFIFKYQSSSRGSKKSSQTTKSEPELLYENLQYNYSIVLPGGWRTSELDTSGKVIALISPQSPKTVKSRQEILKSNGLIIEPQISGIAKSADLIAYRNDWEKYLQKSGVEFDVEFKKIGRYDSYIFNVKVPKNKANITQEIEIFIDTTPKILIQTLTLDSRTKAIISQIEGNEALFKENKKQIDQINTFLGNINQKKYEEALLEINNKQVKSAEALKKLVAGKEDWFGGASAWYSISTQGEQELYRGAIFKGKEKHIVLVRMGIQGSVRTVREFSITPDLFAE